MKKRELLFTSTYKAYQEDPHEDVDDIKHSLRNMYAEDRLEQVVESTIEV